MKREKRNKEGKQKIKQKKGGYRQIEGRRGTSLRIVGQSRPRKLLVM